MKNDENTPAIKNDTQVCKDLKKDMPIKNAMTDNIKNSASRSPGLNQDLTTRDDLLPSDGDNLTS